MNYFEHSFGKIIILQIGLLDLFFFWKLFYHIYCFLLENHIYHILYKDFYSYLLWHIIYDIPTAGSNMVCVRETDGRYSPLKKTLILSGAFCILDI